MSSNSVPVNTFSLTSSLIVHVLFLAPTIYITYLSFQRNYTLFFWHSVCFTIGCGLLMAEATFVVSGEALLAAKVSRVWRVRIHWILHSLGLILVVIGTVTVYVYMTGYNGTHFQSDHALVGLAGSVVSVVVALGGVPILHPKVFSKVSSLATLKTLHGFLGVSALALLIAGQITGIYTGWWRASETNRTISTVAYTVGTAVVLAKPFWTTLLRVRDIFLQ